MTTRSFRWVDSAGIERTVTEEELRTQLAGGVIPKSALVCEVPGDAWVHAEELDGIGPPPSTGFVPPPPPFVEDVQRQFEGKLSRSEPAPPAAEPIPTRAVKGGTLMMPAPPPRPPPPSARPPSRAMAGGTLVGGLAAPAPHPRVERARGSSPPRGVPSRARLLVVVGVVGAVALLGVLGVVLSWLRAPSVAPVAAVSTSSALPPSSASVPSVAPPPPTAATPPSANESLAACKVVKGPSRLALRASKEVPIELAAVPARGIVALGFSPDGRTARGLTVDPAALLAKPELPPFARGVLRHVTPAPTQVGAKWLVDADLPKAAVAPTVSVAAEPAYAVGIADGALVLVGAAGEAPRTLWTLPGTVDAMRALPLADAGALIALRAESGVYVGRLGPDRAPRGELTLISAPGQVGAPALGTNGVEVGVVFGWRASASDPWTIRFSHAGRSEPLPVASVFAVAPGGPGGDAFAPALAGLADGRWLLAWTEGASGSRAVRALTLSSGGAPLGAPLLLSAGVASAGQATLAVVGSAAGLAVFLTTTKRGTYDLWGASLSCS